MADEPFTLHLRAWRLLRRLPRLVRIWLGLVVVGVLIDVVFLSGSDPSQPVRAAVVAAVREATGADPGGACSALSPGGLSQVITDFASGPITGGVPQELAECQQLVGRLRSQVPAAELADFARGSVRAVQFRPDGSALVVYLSANRRLGAELTMRRYGSRWLIDGVAGGAVAGSGA